MEFDQYGMELLGAISAAELGRLQRRVMFLEAAVAQLLRDKGQLREWFTASELAAMMLPGLPRTRSGMTHMARAARWETRIALGRGGERQLFHFASLPRRAFEAMIDLVLRTASEAASAEASGQPPKLPAVAAVAATVPGPDAANATPQWVLPLLRILRSAKKPMLEDALRQLPIRVGCPSVDEARAVLASLGLARGA